MVKKVFACLLALCMLGGAVACADDGQTTDTDVGTSAGTSAEESTDDTTDTTVDTTEDTTDDKTDDTTADTENSESDTVGDEDVTLPLPTDYEVTEKDGTASVRTPSGLAYTVTGYTGSDKAAFTFEKGLTITFAEDVFAEDFNRFTMTYASTQPLKVYMTYTESATPKEEYYFLDAGEGTFSGLNTGFMDKLTARQLTSLRVESCTDRAAEFTLAGLTVETMDVPKATYYIENSRFKLGIDLGWGGTINYLNDRNCPVSGLSNLVNKHDTGRLIQQSFYGTAGVPGEYEPGISFDVKWVYNPVQGGDQYNNASRLIDLVITETSIYIKSQPQDWSLDGQLTPSYMENTYTLYEDHVRVDNRFTDYSGWEHPYTGQELPALYTVSYLDKFVWYDGDDSWTGDTLSYRDDLNFWGDSAYDADCTFTYREKNTETWCAWVNSSNDYGIGLYVPNVDRLKAGRFEYDGAKSAKSNSTNYVAPVNIMKLVSFTPLSYSYMLTAGTTEEIRNTFTKHKDFTDNKSLHENYQSLRIPSVEGDLTNLDFSEGNNLSLLMNLVNTTVTYDAEEKAVKLLSGSLGDSNLSIPYGELGETLSADTYTTLRIEYMIPTDNANASYDADIFLCAGDISVPTGDARVRVRLVKDGEYHVLEVDLSAYAFWTGDIHLIRFDYFDFSVDGDVMYVKNISLS